MVAPFICVQNTKVHFGPVSEMTGVRMSAVSPNFPLELSAYKYQPSVVFLEKRVYRIMKRGRGQVQRLMPVIPAL